MEIQLDVSKLPPPEPLDLSLDAVAKLDAGNYLHIFHRMDPRLLFPLLDDSGYLWEKRFGPRGFDIFVWRAGDSDAQQQVTLALSAMAN